MRCFKVQKETICVNTEEKIMINLSKRKYKIMTDDEYEELMKKLEQNGKQNGKELEVFIVSDHRYFPRIDICIYRVQTSAKKYKYFIEEYDGSSASYSYIFCKSMKECEGIIYELEEDNIAMD